jgi:hypothetical protein
MKAYALTLGLLVVSGCGTFVTEIRLNPSPRPLAARAPESVEILASSGPARPHVDVALVEVWQNYGGGIEAVVQSLREWAGAKGCDAVFIMGMQRGGQHSPATMPATCVVYTDGDAGSPPGASAPPVVAPPPAPLPPGAAPAAPDGRRTCVTREDFETHRNCVLRTVK